MNIEAVICFKIYLMDKHAEHIINKERCYNQSGNRFWIE